MQNRIAHKKTFETLCEELEYAKEKKKRDDNSIRKARLTESLLDLGNKTKTVRQIKSGADDTILKHVQESNVESAVGVQNIVDPTLHHISGIAGNIHRKFTPCCMCDTFSSLITVICLFMMIQVVKCLLMWAFV